MKFGYYLTGLALFSACAGETDDVDLDSGEQEVVVGQHISDGNNLPGTANFFFLPTLANPFTPTGQFDATLKTRLKVRVDNLSACNDTATVTTTAFTFNTVQLAVAAETYKVITTISGAWVTGNCYRITPTLDNNALGFRDVHVTAGTAANGFRKFAPTTNQTIPWRIEVVPPPADTDSDGVPDSTDNCVNVPNQNQANADGDAFGDACDACPLDSQNDSDADGVCGNIDNCPTVSNSDQANADSDNLGDACDVCPLDSQNDVDGDTICGNVDNCPTVSNQNQANADGDALGDACDVCANDPQNDVDGDTVCGDVDNCPTVSNQNQANADSDAFGDACDVCANDAQNDIDGDTVCGDVDNCPTVSNQNQANADSDAFGDACEVCDNDPANDIDGDGVCGNIDNCPTVSNADQADSDNDGIGNACDSVTQHISDGNNLPGTANFFFLPTLANAFTPTGTFDATLKTRLKVRVDNLSSCNDNATVTTTAFTFNTVSLAVATETYKVVTNISGGWVSGNCYRITPTLDNNALGFRDVHVTAGDANNGFRKYAPGTNQTIPFRIEIP